MTREELEKIYNEPKTTLTREKLNEIYSPAKTVKTSGTKATLSSHDLMERQKRNARVNQYKTEKKARNEANKIKSQQITDKLMGIETAEVGAEKYNSAPINTVDVKSLSKTAENPVDKWLDSSYKLSKDEKKEAKDISEAYMKEIRNKRGNLSDEEMQKYNQMAKLYTKSHVGSSIMAGIADAIPFYDTAMDAAYKKLGYGDDFSEQWEDTKENAKNQNPIAYTGANIGMNLAKYGTGTELLKGAGLLGESGKITKGVSKVIKNPKVAGSVANILGDTSLDIALDTIPQLAKDISKGDEKAGTNALKNVGANLALNTLGEGAGIVVGKGLDKLANKNIGKAEILNPLEDYANNVEEITVGNATKIKSPYKGDMPIQNSTSFARVEVPQSYFDDAVTNMNLASVDSKIEGRSKVYVLKKVYETLFDNNNQTAKNYNVKDLIFEDNPYVVTVNKNAIGKIVSDKNLSPEKVAVIDDLENIISNAQYVGSGNYVDYKNTGKTKNVKRYDYFETLARINGEDYVVTFDVEVVPGSNNYRTHKVINEINLSKANQFSTGTGPVPAVSTDAKKGISDISIPDSLENVNAITDYKKVNIPNHDEMNKNIDKYVGMYGDDAAKSKALEFKQSVNRVIAENSEEAWEELIKNTNELDAMLQGKTYTFKNQKSDKNKSNVRQATYNNEIRDIFTFETDSISKEAAENALNNANALKNNVSQPIQNPVADSAEKEMAKSRYASETIVNKTDIPDEVKNEFRENPKMYEVLKNKDTDARANEIFENNDFNTAYAEFDRLLEDRDAVAIPLGYKLAKQLAESGATQQAVDIVDKMSDRLTKAGQFTQSAAITMLQGDPMASMRYMQKQLQKMNVTGAENYKNWKKLELTEDEIKAFSNIEPKDTEAIMDLYNQIADRLAKEYPSSTWEKIVELSKTSMMLHSRTHIRNIASNAIMVPVRSLSDRVSALGQNAVKLFKPDLDVTQSLIGGTSEQKKIANQIFESQIKPLLDDAGKWNNVAKNAPRNKQVFKDSKIGAAAKKGFVWSASQANNLTGGKLENLVNTLDKSMTDSVLENLRKFDYWLLGEVEDNPFVKKNFTNRLASYMRAQKINNIDSVPNEAVQIAYQEALKATFKDDNAMTKTFSNLKGLLGKFGEVAMPFTKTPANIAMRGLDYSPAGIVNAIKQAKSGNDIGQIMDTVGKSATGTAGILLGYKLAENGLIQGALSSDADKQQFEKQQGKVAYSIKVGDNYISFDFAQPASIPIIIGTTIYDSLKESDMDAEKLFNTAYQATGAAFNSWLELSPLQSLQDMLGGSGYGDTNVFENVANETLEFPQRLIPSALGATARTIDPVYRQTYSKGNVLQTQLDTAKAKIPGLSDELPISYDTWGNPRRRQDNTMSAAIANFVNPGTLGYDASTPIDSEIERLFESTQSNSVFPQKASWSVKNGNGETVELTNEQYSRYQKEMGQTSYSIAETVVNSDYYSNLSDEDKAECLSLVYSISKADTNNKLFGTKVADTTKKYVEIYNMNGPEGLVNYLQRKHDFDTYGVNSTGKIAQAAYAKNGIEGIEDYSNYTSYANSLGLSINESTYNIWQSEGKAGLDNLKKYKTDISALGLNDGSVVKQLHKDGGKRYLEIYKDINADGKNGITDKELKTYKGYSSLSPLEEAYFKNKSWKK